MRKTFTYDDVNKAIKNVAMYLSSIENVWNEPRNLKLYDAFFKADELLKKYPLVEAQTNSYDAFHDFCEDAYTYGLQDEFNNGYLQDLRVYVRRTSTFYITDLYTIHNDMTQVISALLVVLNSHVDFDFNDDLTMKPLTWSDYYTEAELIEEYQGDMEYLVKEFIYDVKKYMKDAIELAKYIDTYKENQVEYFDEWLSNENDRISWQNEENQKAELEAKIQEGCEAIAYTI